jgi:hypothetical protein
LAAVQVAPDALILTAALNSGLVSFHAGSLGQLRSGGSDPKRSQDGICVLAE